MKEKILLHSCCAICSAYPIERLKELGYEPVVYFYNPNIYPLEEYNKRMVAQKELCEFEKVELIVGEYDFENFSDFVKGLENEPEKGLRCDKCFELRLNKTFQKAKELKIKKITTSIVISPHKNFSKLTKIGDKLALKYSIEYVGIDFKKQNGYLKTNQISKELNLYRQNYCGCKYSVRT